MAHLDRGHCHRDRFTVQGIDDLGGLLPGEEIGERGPGQIGAAQLEKIRVFREAGGRDLVDRHRPPVDVGGLRRSDRRNGAPVVASAIDQECKRMIRDTAVRMDASEVSCRIAAVSHSCIRMAEAPRIPQVAGCTVWNSAFADQPPHGFVGGFHP